MYFVGYDIGSSSVKATLLEGPSGKRIASATSALQEIRSPRQGWAEQDPGIWWKNVVEVTRLLQKNTSMPRDSVKGIGLTYQMHGLVLVDRSKNVLRPAIIWCDSRAVSIGEEIFSALGKDYCLTHLRNSPGNFTASKLAWVQRNEPEIYSKVYKAMLPGDFIAMRMTGDINTTACGLSEGIFWDFKNGSVSDRLLGHLKIDPSLLPEVIPSFSRAPLLSSTAAAELGWAAGTPVSYRAGDQPNNAFALNVNEPGDIAANAGTSGVIYSVSQECKTDPGSRVNDFLHVTQQPTSPRIGTLLCINGAGILNTWIKDQTGAASFDDMNRMAANIQPGSEGLQIFPFGNGAERMLGNADPGASIQNLQLNRHGVAHLYRATQEGIAYAMNYGLHIMRNLEINPARIRAGKANMFLSPVFRRIFVALTGVPLELMDADGALGAAKGAAVGAGYYSGVKEAFQTSGEGDHEVPQKEDIKIYTELYGAWMEQGHKNHNLQ